MVSREQINKDELVVEYQQYVASIAKSLMRTMSLPAEVYDDLVSAGYLGLVESTERYDPDKSDSFKNYAFLRIRGAMVDSLKVRSGFTRRGYKYKKALKAAHDIAETQYERKPYGVPDDTGDFGLAKIFDYIAKGAIAFRLSVDEVSDDGLVADIEDPEVQLGKKEVIRKLMEMIDTLPEKEKLVMEEYYLNDKSFVEITEMHEDLSKSWVSRLHLRAIERIRDEFTRMHGEITY